MLQEWSEMPDVEFLAARGSLDITPRWQMHMFAPRSHDMTCDLATGWGCDEKV